MYGMVNISDEELKELIDIMIKKYGHYPQPEDVEVEYTSMDLRITKRQIKKLWIGET